MNVLVFISILCTIFAVISARDSPTCPEAECSTICKCLDDNVLHLREGNMDGCGVESFQKLAFWFGRNLLDHEQEPILECLKNKLDYANPNPCGCTAYYDGPLARSFPKNVACVRDTLRTACFGSCTIPDRYQDDVDVCLLDGLAQHETFEETI